jgi:hypothetical protein
MGNKLYDDNFECGLCVMGWVEEVWNGYLLVF